MNKIQTYNFLKTLAKLFPSIQLDETTIAAWEFALADENENEVATATRFLMRQGVVSFINPSHILQAVQAQRITAPSDPNLAWQQRGRVEGDDIAADAWRTWGGDRRYGQSVDINHPGLTSDERRRYHAEKKEFLEIYNGLVARKQHMAAMGISRDDARSALEQVATAVPTVRKFEVIK